LHLCHEKPSFGGWIMGNLYHKRRGVVAGGANALTVSSAGAIKMKAGGWIAPTRLHPAGVCRLFSVGEELCGARYCR